MCGRYTLTRPAADVAEQFQVAVPPLHQRFNIAPTQDVLALRKGEEKSEVEACFLRWGLVPSWASDLSIGNRLLNARAETVVEKPSFRTAFQRRRCLIIADGFYEWRTVKGTKQPVYFHFRDGRLFAFAGLWERWQPAAGPAVESCTILTTNANDLIRPVHERMPVILDPVHHAGWLDLTQTNASVARSWLTTFPSADMTVTPASVRVNNPRNEGPACLEAA